MGVPTVAARHLVFGSRGEIILHDAVVVGVVLRLDATGQSPRGIELADWIAGASAQATLDELALAFGARPQFAGFGIPYFAVDGGYVRATFADNRGWKEPGNLRSLTVTAAKPGLAIRPEDDACPVCSDLLVRDDRDGVDVGPTVASLAAALDADLVTEDSHWVPLADLQPLHASRLMARVESQLRCTSCRRIMCFVLARDAPAAFGYFVVNDAQRHPLSLIPPVEEWGDAERIDRGRAGMRYRDHEPGRWFLVEKRGELYLDARYNLSNMIDDSALIQLDDSEALAYELGGHDYIARLAKQVHDDPPHREKSRYHSRDLYQSPEGRAYRDAVGRAIVNHTWLAQQRNG